MTALWVALALIFGYALGVVTIAVGMAVQDTKRHHDPRGRRP